MKTIASKFLYFFGSLCTIFCLVGTTGCASGGFKLTRQYARFVNSNNIILRVVLYVLTFVVFGVTLLIDMVVFNTMDFWNGTVSQGIYEFVNQDKKFVVEHKILPNQRRRSTIQIQKLGGEHLQEVVLAETPEGNIDVFVDGVRTAQVHDLNSLPVTTLFDNKGQVTSHLVIPMSTALAQR